MIIIYEGTEAIKQIEVGYTIGIHAIFVDGTLYLDLRTKLESGMYNHVVYKLPEPYDLPPAEIYSYVTDYGYTFWTDSQKNMSPYLGMIQRLKAMTGSCLPFYQPGTGRWFDRSNRPLWGRR